MTTTAPSPTPDSAATAPLLTPLKTADAPTESAPNLPAAATPGAGGCYTCDPHTGAVTLATPSTTQE